MHTSGGQLLGSSVEGRPGGGVGKMGPESEEGGRSRGRSRPHKALTRTTRGLGGRFEPNSWHWATTPSGLRAYSSAPLLGALSTVAPPPPWWISLWLSGVSGPGSSISLAMVGAHCSLFTILSSTPHLITAKRPRRAFRGGLRRSCATRRRSARWRTIHSMRTAQAHFGRIHETSGARARVREVRGRRARLGVLSSLLE